MSDERSIAAALQTLQSRYGAPPTAPPDAAWRTCLRELLDGPDLQHAAAIDSVLHDAALQSPGACAAASTGALVELLAAVPRGAQKAGVLKGLARWWLDEFGDEESPEWTRGTEHYRAGLRAVRGLGPETVDRLLLFAAGLRVFPVDRATLRVAVRHGWLDLPVDDEQAQATFGGPLSGEVAALRSAARWLHRVGAAHCGRVPDCAACPLQPLLPPGGPLSPDSC